MGWCWQLPTYDGTKSYQNLLVEVYGIISYASIGYYSKADSQVQSTPLNIVRNGNYRHNYGDIAARSSNGYYWYPEVLSSTSGRDILISETATVIIARGNSKGDGISLRCLVR